MLHRCGTPARQQLEHEKLDHAQKAMFTKALSGLKSIGTIVRWDQATVNDLVGYIKTVVEPRDWLERLAEKVAVDETFPGSPHWLGRRSQADAACWRRGEEVQQGRRPPNIGYCSSQKLVLGHFWDKTGTFLGHTFFCRNCSLSA